MNVFFLFVLYITVSTPLMTTGHNILVNPLISCTKRRIKSLYNAQLLKIGYSKSPHVASNFAGICINLIARFISNFKISVTDVVA